jgi:homospermidine synthase
MLSGRILITGFGIVAQALLPLLLKHLRVPAHRITVVEFAERPQLRPWRKKGVRLLRRLSSSSAMRPVDRSCMAARDTPNPEGRDRLAPVRRRRPANH